MKEVTSMCLLANVQESDEDIRSASKEIGERILKRPRSLKRPNYKALKKFSPLGKTFPFKTRKKKRFIKLL